MTDITLSDWVLVCTTLFLGGVALVTPLVGDSIKRWWARPKIQVEYRPYPPGSHKTRLDVRLSPAQVEVCSTYYFRLAVTNDGRTQARKCEAVIEQLWVAGPDGHLRQLPHYGPNVMIWGAGYDQFVDINPSRLFYCDFLSVPDDKAQKLLVSGGAFVDHSPFPSDSLGLVISSKAAFYSQPNRLPPGRYRFVVALFAENADPTRKSFDVDWSGEWHDSERAMLIATTIR